MLTAQEIESIFRKTGAMLTGHFLLTSGLHSDRYFQCAMVLQYPDFTEILCRELARRFADLGITAVVGPAVGGIVVSYELSRALVRTRSLFAERENGVMRLRRGFTIKPGEKVLVVEDVITTGGSVRETIDALREMGGDVAGVGVLVDRSNGSIDFGVKTEALLITEAVTYQSDDCPLCREGLPVTKPGSRET